MKLTSYETSKKLEELGFKAEHDYCYDKKGKDQTQCWNVSHELSCWDGYDEELYYPAYDLETMIKSLPSEIVESVEGDDNYKSWLTINRNHAGYITEDDCWHWEYVFSVQYKARS